MGKVKSYFFRHDCNARDDDKIINLRMDKGVAGYGLYFLLLELLSTADNCTIERNYKKIAFQLNVDADDIKDVIENYELFKLTDDGKFYSVRLQHNMGEIIEMQVKKSEAGKKGMESRWKKENGDDGNNGTITMLSNSNNDVITKSLQEDNNKKRKDKTESLRAGAGAPAREGGDSSRFVRPTVDEVRAYCEERGNGIDPEEFVAFYESKGWRVGKDPMKSWKGAVVTWEKKRKKKADEEAQVLQRRTPPPGVCLGYDEWMREDGTRTYASGTDTVPLDAPPRPNSQCCWSSTYNSWIM